MNRMRFVALCVAVSLWCFSMAFGIDLADPAKAPATYVKVVKQGEKNVLVFDDTTHWFSAATFDEVMGLYGCTLTGSCNLKEACPALREAESLGSAWI